MKQAGFRRAQRDGLFEPHIAPVNRLIDEIGAAGPNWLPHVAPIHGGINSRVLWLARDPGPKTKDPDHADSGFLCVENDDPSAERLCDLLDRSGIAVEATLPWNAYPWYINRPPRIGELKAGLEPLRRLLELLPRLDVLILLGQHAQRSWDLFTARHPADVAGFKVLATRHPGRQAFVGTKEQRATRREEQALVFDRAGEILRDPDRSIAQRLH